MLGGKETLVTVVPPEVAANLPVPEVLESVSVVALALVVALPKVSSRVTVKAFVAEAFAAPPKALEVMSNCVPVAPVMVSPWVPEARPVAPAVMVGVPALVSP